LKKDHTAKYQNLLKQVLQSGTLVEDQPTPPTGEGGGGGGEGEGSTAEQQLKSFGSVAELETADGPFIARCASEITGIEVIKGKSGQIYLLSDRARIISKHSLVGGFGTGKFLASSLQGFACFCKVFLIVFGL